MEPFTSSNGALPGITIKIRRSCESSTLRNTMKPSNLATLVLILFSMVRSTTAAEVALRDQFRTKADFDLWMKELSNWGRWGKDDQLGALNLVTPAKRTAALKLAKQGVSVSLARDVEKEQASDNGSPFVHKMDRAGTNNTGFSCADTYS